MTNSNADNDHIISADVSLTCCAEQSDRSIMQTLKGGMMYHKADAIETHGLCNATKVVLLIAGMLNARSYLSIKRGGAKIMLWNL